MEKEVQKMKDFIGYEPASSVPRITSEYRIQTLLKYEQVIKSTSLSDIPYEGVRNCSKLIWLWYEARFSHSSELHPNFRYNIRRLKDWLLSIVILYGKYHESGDTYKYIQMFHSWINDLDKPKYDKYAVPYEVYSVSRNVSSSDLTLTSLVIWDVLKDFGYSELFKFGGELVPKEEDIYDICADKNPSVLDRYRNYQFDRSIISECNLQGVKQNAI